MARNGAAMSKTVSNTSRRRILDLMGEVARLKGELAERAIVYDDHIIAEKTRNVALAAALRGLTEEEPGYFPVDHGNPGMPGDKGVQVENEQHCLYCDANIDRAGAPHNDGCVWVAARAALSGAAREATDGCRH